MYDLSGRFSIPSFLAILSYRDKTNLSHRAVVRIKCIITCKVPRTVPVYSQWFIKVIWDSDGDGGDLF